MNRRDKAKMREFLRLCASGFEICRWVAARLCVPKIESGEIKVPKGMKEKVAAAILDLRLDPPPDYCGRMAFPNYSSGYRNVDIRKKG